MIYENDVHCILETLLKSYTKAATTFATSASVSKWDRLDYEHCLGACEGLTKAIKEIKKLSATNTKDIIKKTQSQIPF